MPSIKLGEFWELPYLIPLEDKYVFMVGCGNPYWIGEYDREQLIFTPDDDGMKSIDNGAYYLYSDIAFDDIPFTVLKRSHATHWQEQLLPQWNYLNGHRAELKDMFLLGSAAKCSFRS